MRWQPEEIAMIKAKDIQIAARQLWADPAYLLVVVISLAVALRPGSEALMPERTVQFEHRDTTRQQATQWDSQSPFVARQALLDSHAPLTATTRYKQDDPTSVRVGDHVFKLKVSYADPDFTKLFAITPLAGNLHQVLTHPDQVALIESTATRLFGDTPAMGKILSIGGQRVTVGAILPKPKAGSLINTDLLLGFDSLPAMQWAERKDLLTEWGMNTANVWAQLAPNATAADLEALVAQLYAKSDYVAHLPPEMKMGDTPSKLFRATPFSRLALDGAGNEGQRRLVWSLLAAAVTMLLLATINYTNLSTVRTLKRPREIGLRKSLGATAHKIVTQFVLESVVIVTGACALAVLLAWLLVPALGDLVNQPPLADMLFRSWRLPMILLLALQLGLATGLYPAWIAVGAR
jgi:putative ABC transport system permease protein